MQRLIQHWEEVQNGVFDESVQSCTLTDNESFEVEVKGNSEVNPEVTMDLDARAPAILRPTWLGNDLLDEPAIPRPKLGWEGRRVKFGKTILIFHNFNWRKIPGHFFI